MTTIHLDLPSSFLKLTNPEIYIIIPAYNEAASIGKVIDEIPKKIVKEILVIDNGSSDETGKVARAHGAKVLHEPKKGYGYACQNGIQHLQSAKFAPEIIVFLDGDHSDYPSQLSEVIGPIIKGDADLVIGSRKLGNAEKGSMTFPQRFGNWLATFLIERIFGVAYTDLGPFRAIRYDKLLAMNMADKNYGWTVEMQIKAPRQGLKIVEVPVNYRKRIGVSKVSGTIPGAVKAGIKIIYTIIKYM